MMQDIVACWPHRIQALFTVMLLLMSLTLHAAEFTISYGLNADIGDANPGDGIAETVDSVTTLRAAVEESNALAGPDRILMIYGSSEYVETSLPVTDDLEIRAPDQPCSPLYGCHRISGGENVFTVSEGKTLTLFLLYVDGCRYGDETCSTVVLEPDAKLILNGSFLSGGKPIRGGGVYNRGGEVHLSSVIFEDLLLGTDVEADAARDSLASWKVPFPLPPLDPEEPPGISGSASEDGGGIYNEGGLVVASGRCWLGGYADGRGGAIYNDGGTVRISALGVGPHWPSPDRGLMGGRASSGGFLYNASGTVELEEIMVSGSQSKQEQVYVAGGTVNVRNAQFEDCKGTSGGAVRVAGGTFRVENTLFNACSASGDGGALYASGGSTALLNCTFTGNTAVGHGGAIYATSEAALDLLNCTLTLNTAEEGGGLYAGAAKGSPMLRLGNTIIAQNTAPLRPEVSGAVLSLGHNLIGDTDGATGFGAPGDLTGNPAAPLDARLNFLLIPYDERRVYTAAAGTPIHALLEDSPARDAGSMALLQDPTLLPEPPAHDQRGPGYPRDLGSEVDIGAYEYPVPQFHSADRNTDERISLSELLRPIQFYNLAGYHCDTLGEDGYAPGPGDTLCTAHTSDYLPQDWLISLSELMRAIQFYNIAGYHLCGESEDGFCPGA